VKSELCIAEEKILDDVKAEAEKQFKTEKHVHLSCNVKLRDFEDTVVGIIKTHKNILDKYI